MNAPHLPRRLTAALATVLLAATPFRADLKVEEFWIDMPATQGASVTSYSDGDTLRHALVLAMSDRDAYGLRVTPFGPDDTVLEFAALSYSGHIVDDVPLITTRTSAPGR